MVGFEYNYQRQQADKSEVVVYVWMGVCGCISVISVNSLPLRQITVSLLSYSFSTKIVII